MGKLRTCGLSIDEPPTKDIALTIQAWNGWRNGRLMPSWRDVNLLDIPSSSLKMTLVIDIHYDPLIFNYRFWGTGLTQVHGIDLTGGNLNDLPWPEFRNLIEQAYHQVMEERLPWLYVGEFVKPYDAIAEEYVLRLPLSSNDDIVDGIAERL